MGAWEDVLKGLFKAPASGGVAPASFEIPGHVKAGGVGFLGLSWAIELKETVLADLDPVVHCRNFGEAVWVYIHLPSSQYLGMVAWNLIFGVTTFGLYKLIRSMRRKPPRLA